MVREPGLWWFIPQFNSWIAPVFFLLGHKNSKIDLDKPKINPKAGILFLDGKIKHDKKKQLIVWKSPDFHSPASFICICKSGPSESCFQHSLTSSVPFHTSWLFLVGCHLIPLFPLKLVLLYRAFVLVNSFRLHILWSLGPCVILLYFEMHSSGLETQSVELISVTCFSCRD